MSNYIRKPSSDLPEANKMNYADHIEKQIKRGNLEKSDYVFTKTKEGKLVRPKQIPLEHFIESKLKIKSWNGSFPPA